MRNLNPVRRENVSADQPVTLRAYVRAQTGSAMSPGTAATEAFLTWQFLKPGQLDSYPTYQIASMAYFVVAAPAGMANDPLPGLWEPTIDGPEGFNLTVQLPRLITYLPRENDIANWSNPLEQGLYRLVVRFDGVYQEFEISSRA